MGKEVKALVFYGDALNCDRETEYAMKLAGAYPERIILSDIYDKKASLLDYHILVFGGGFHRADDGGAGVLWAYDFKRNVGKELFEFINSGKLIIGICNGYQALVNIGVLPGLNGNYDKKLVNVTYNNCGNFIDDWVTLNVNPDSRCIWTEGIDKIDLPIRHGEGNVIASDEVLKELKENNQIVMRYQHNPNGSLEDIAGICDPSGKIFALMPHPEAYWDQTEHPYYTKRREECIEQGKPIPKGEGDGIKIFRNAVEYVKENLL